MLKGGVLLAAHDTRRPTNDIDFQAQALGNDADTVLRLVREISAIDRDATTPTADLASYRGRG